MNTVEEIIADVRAGKMVIILDDESRENEGDLIMAAEAVTPAAINFMITHARGLLCLPMSAALGKKLNLPLMVQDNRSVFATNFTISIEAATGVGSGISVTDRATTILAAVADHATATDLVSPGHIFPLLADVGGVLMRPGHTEAACELARLAGFKPAGVLIEILNADGTMAHQAECVEFALQHRLKLGTIADLIDYLSR